MKSVLIASYDMDVGGVERSLAGMLDRFDYRRHSVDLMLYRHQGDFMALLSDRANLLPEERAYATFRQSVAEVMKNRHFAIGIGRILSKLHVKYLGERRGIPEPGYYQMQLMWKYTLPFLPKSKAKYDAAISYLWPHYYVADKVEANMKIAWIHTDYSTIATDREMDLAMWSKFDSIVAVSEACKESFLAKYGELREKVVVIENVVSTEAIRKLSNEPTDNPMERDDRFKLITVARLSHAKGIDNAVRAMKLLNDRGLDRIVWYVVGYGGDEDAIRELIADNRLEDRFILLGKQTNPYPYIRTGDLYVQPSRYEGKAVTVTEAQVLGKPVLITNYTTAASQVRNGIDGWIAELSVEGIADGIERLYRDEALRSELSANCLRTDYSGSEGLEKLYASIALASKKGGA
ncbi:glycosyltransferase [Cohnella ginsengisoli]|uniref:Glycosyltransferase n=1 Tax=Cohnella ginsengisoli TaxID=425004 RepID=A0A9X4QMV1_9BACL|nr:glycosyltransferase [Cohnella ginsengisoli]MDG0791781.1 glycosyltransferase [Cohnella ginsengisoli]